MKGFVSLVGAGPGNPGLLTLNACQKLKEADIVIYDYLVNPEHLRHTQKNCERICVGKGFRHKKLSQEKINRLIIQEAKKNKKVVRLKGGDPYLFGRGGEEALFLKKHGIPFDVVPGITSFSACAAYAGIPVTHRDHNASVTLLTGHRANDDKLDSIDWSKIASMPGTIAIYMGFYNLPVICHRLLSHGMAPRTPVAVIEWGTLPFQKVSEGKLSEIAAIVRQNKMKPPCMILIGDVVKLRRELNWYEKLPLFGKKILVTRAKGKASILSDKLKKLGAETFEMPVIEILPPKTWKPMDDCIASLSRYDWLIFTSAYGANFFLNRLYEKHDKDTRALGGVRIACVGPETAKILRPYGLRPDLIPDQYETKNLAQSLSKKIGSLLGKKILLVRADIAPKALEEDLKKMGAIPFAVTGYRTVRPKIQTGILREMTPDYVTFTSSSTANNFIQGVGAPKAKKILSKTFVASIGPVTSKSLRQNKVRVDCEARQFHLDGLVEAIKNHAGKHL